MTMKVDIEGKREFSNLLDWWHDNQCQFSLSALLVRKILCIPSTSAPTERVFSTAAHTKTKLRAPFYAATAANQT